MTFRSLVVAAGLLCWSVAPVIAQPHEDAHTEHADEHASDEHAEHGHGTVTLGAIVADDNFIASLISFSLLILIVYFGARRTVRAALETRKSEIESAVAEARRREEEAEAKRKEFEDRLSRLDGEMEKIREEVVKAGELERDRIVAEAEAKAALMRKDAQFQIEQKFKQLRDDLTAEAIMASVAAATEILEAKTTASDQQKLADVYLQKVGELAEEKRA